ncbi:MAG: DVU0772 family protein [Thermodesulfobacteriota bacterium]
MLTWDELKRRPEIIRAIDWQITPAQAFAAYQIKSPGAWQQRDLGPVYYFYLSTWRGENRVLLVRRGYTESETMAEAPAPAELVAALAARAAGTDMPRGQVALDEPLKVWLRRELGLQA